jgi:hypothetical protein
VPGLHGHRDRRVRHSRHTDQRILSDNDSCPAPERSATSFSRGIRHIRPALPAPIERARRSRDPE